MVFQTAPYASRDQPAERFPDAKYLIPMISCSASRCRLRSSRHVVQERTFAPNDLTGPAGVAFVKITPDSRAIAFEYFRRLGYLYLLGDGGTLKVFRGTVTMKFDDPAQATVKPTMAHFFYMDPKNPSKVIRWLGAVGPTTF